MRDYFAEARREQAAGTKCRNDQDFDAASRHFNAALGLYREVILHGGDNVSIGLIKMGMTYWRDRHGDVNYQQYARKYWKAALMYDSNPWGWLQLAEFNRVTNAKNFYESRCFFKSAWWNTKDGDLRANEIGVRAYRLGVDEGFFSEKIKADGLERLWGIASSFWIFQYQAYAAVTKDHQEGMGDFGKVAAVWCRLHSHFGLSTSPLYLVYVENDFNREIIAVMQWVLQSLGYDTTLIAWSQVGDYLFPKNAVIAILDDISLLAKPDEINQKSYANIQQHKGNKFLVPWQVPDDLFSLDRWPEHWKFCKRLKASLRDDPVSLIFRELSRYVYTGSCRFLEDLYYLEERVANAAQLLYQDNLDVQMRAISVLWSGPETYYGMRDVSIEYASHKPEQDKQLLKSTAWLSLSSLLQKTYFVLSGSIVQRVEAHASAKVVSEDQNVLHELSCIQYFCEHDGVCFIKPVERNKHVFSNPGFYNQNKDSYSWPTLMYFLEDIPEQHVRISLNRKPITLFSMVYFRRAWPPVFHALYDYLVKVFLPQVSQFVATADATENDEDEPEEHDIAVDNAVVVLQDVACHGVKNTVQLANAIAIRPSSADTLAQRVSLKYAEAMLELYANIKLKKSEDMREIAFFIYSNNPKIMRTMFLLFKKNLSDPNYTTMYERIEQLVQLERLFMRVEPSVIHRSDLVQLMEVLINGLANTHHQHDDEDFLYQMLRTIAALMMLMQAAKVARVSRVKWEEEYFVKLAELKSWISPRFRSLLEFIIEAMERIPRDESTTGHVARRTYHLVFLLGNFMNPVVAGLNILKHGLLPRDIGKFTADGHAGAHFFGLIQHTVIWHIEWYEALHQCQRLAYDIDMAVKVSALDVLKKYLEDLVGQKKPPDAMLIMGVVQVLDNVIRTHRVAEFRVAVLQLLGQLLQWVRIWEHHDPTLIQNVLQYLQVYAQAPETCGAIASEAKAILQRLNSCALVVKKSAWQSVSDLFSRTPDTVWQWVERSVVKKTDDCFVVPPLKAAEPVCGMRLFNMVKKDIQDAVNKSSVVNAPS